MAIPSPLTASAITYDAFGRMVERAGAYSPFYYAPTGLRMQTLAAQAVPLVGGATAVYGNGTIYLRHADHLGSSRLTTNYFDHTMYADAAYAPFGEPYAQSGATDLSFTGMNQDTVSGLYDFPARKYSIQGRWASPDPANPQSWNAYAYSLNNPLAFTDPSGLDPCQGANVLNSVKPPTAPESSPQTIA